MSYFGYISILIVEVGYVVIDLIVIKLIGDIFKKINYGLKWHAFSVFDCLIIIIWEIVVDSFDKHDGKTRSDGTNLNSSKFSNSPGSGNFFLFLFYFSNLNLLLFRL
jgi:hypothetical protein